MLSCADPCRFWPSREYDTHSHVHHFHSTSQSVSTMCIPIYLQRTASCISQFPTIGELGAMSWRLQSSTTGLYRFHRIQLHYSSQNGSLGVTLLRYSSVLGSGSIAEGWELTDVISLSRSEVWWMLDCLKSSQLPSSVSYGSRKATIKEYETPNGAIYIIITLKLEGIQATTVNVPMCVKTVLISALSIATEILD